MMEEAILGHQGGCGLAEKAHRRFRKTIFREANSARMIRQAGFHQRCVLEIPRSDDEDFISTCQATSTGRLPCRVQADLWDEAQPERALLLCILKPALPAEDRVILPSCPYPWQSSCNPEEIYEFQAQHGWIKGR